jgi:hypothetical protein
LGERVVTRAKVKDFNTWKPAYDAHQAARGDAGLTEQYLLRNADDANEISSFLKCRISIERRRLPRLVTPLGNWTRSPLEK